MKTVAISILGTSLDRRGKGNRRWDRWRPTISMCQQDDMVIDRLELLFGPQSQTLADQVTEDIGIVSPETQVKQHHVEFDNPWDFESVYATLLDFARSYPFKTKKENYLIHITTGTHVAQICLYLLTEARYLPGQLLQTSPGPSGQPSPGQYQLIDLDLSKYDLIASRFRHEHEEGTSYLKGGIETRNADFNRMIEQIEQVSIRSTDPMLLTGPTGAGKSQLAKRIFSLKQQRGQVKGNFIAINCATLRGENAMSALFGHKKGAFTGAASHRPGLLKEAHEGLLFLDEIGELGLDEQAMLLRAIEDKHFLPLGADREDSSDFQLIAGTNRDLFAEVENSRFREDLLARINLWTYQLPGLRDRLEDLEANIDFELERWMRKRGEHISFNKSARSHYLTFAQSHEARWTANFRDLNASITRMSTLAPGGRINEAVVAEEIQRLQHNWQRRGQSSTMSPHQNLQQPILDQLLSKEQWQQIDLFEKVQLQTVIEVCLSANSMADAGRRLFNISRLEKKSHNDSHRVRQILKKYDITFEQIQQAKSP